MSPAPPSRRPRIVVLTGATASGKSALALDLAERLGAEIVGADSQQVYRGLDVGTAKPTAADRTRVPHHLLDVAEPGEQLTVARYLALADAAIADIHRRGRRVLVVGGTGLWIRALLHGLAPAPPRDDALRAELEAFADAEGSPALHARLAEVDPEAAARLHPHDRLRLVRALEVHRLSGRPLSGIQADHRFALARYPHRLLALRLPREVLRARIHRRVEAMLDAGWADEVRRLLAHEGGAHRLPRVLGYAEVAAWAQGDLDRATLVDRLAARTWQYARRQGTWLRKEPGVVWLDPDFDPGRLGAGLEAWLTASGEHTEAC